ncbi:MAG: hypothetical protein JHC34_08605 [Acidobacteria bacterium]|nr:hypothetical protein [Acidobacteriota bacterium]
MAQEAVPRGRAYGAALLTLLAPGLGHWLLGRRGRGVALFAIVSVTFLSGLLFDGALFPLRAENWLFRLGGIAEAGSGLLYLLGRLLGLGALEQARVTGVMFGYGNTFLVTAGLMNMLLMMDAFDIAIGRKS